MGGRAYALTARSNSFGSVAGNKQEDLHKGEKQTAKLTSSNGAAAALTATATNLTGSVLLATSLMGPQIQL